MEGIVRVRHRRRPYAVIDRAMLEDDRLSWAARGILGCLLAKPDDWQLRISDLRRRGDLGRDALRRVLRELEAHGYLKREQTRDDRGRVTGIAYTVYETAQTPGPGNPAPANPAPVTPDTGLPAPARPPLPSNQRNKYSTNQVTTTEIESAERTAVAAQEAPSARGSGEHQNYREERAPEPSHARAFDGTATDYPTGLSAAEVNAARELVSALDLELAQQVLDELAGRMAARAIRGSPLAYLRALASRAAAGTFTAEMALTVATRRAARRRAEAAVAHAAGRPLALPKADESCPLVQRANAIREQAEFRRAQAANLGMEGGEENAR